MAGLYVHVPFCAQACSYCDFHFTTRLGDRDRMVDALCAELTDALPQWQDTVFNTLYFGGGTPSVLGPDALRKIADAAFSGLRWDLVEWTVEANPEDLDPKTLKRLLAIGVNRLSVGVQSFDADVLAWMRRIHSVDRAERAILDAAEAGFQHLSLDLMYGLPVGNPDRWERDLDRACALPADHMSCYILTAEPRTIYGHQLAAGTLQPPPDDRVVEEYHLLCRTTAAAGFDHYEVSNFALEGGQSRHNSAYWNGTPYLGIGPGAHSFRSARRWWNVRSNAAYLKHAEQRSWAEQQGEEALSDQDRFNEALITGLRRKTGVCPEALHRLTGVDLNQQPALPRLLEQGACEWAEGRLRIPEPRWPMGDAITLELMA